MTYYKVLPQFDQAQVLKARRNGKLYIDRFLIANELYTPAEYHKLLKGADFRGCGIKDNTIIFEKIEASKNKTYFFFGARFEG